MNYYNEHDPKAAAWLRELIAAKLIPAGEVDERDIQKVLPDELRSFTQCHFFAGIGGWSYALKLAGWPDDQPVWTGSCPCQPFSVGSVAHGGAKGSGDHRDLWPYFGNLIRQSAPAIVFGEQVGSAVPWGWWDRAASDLEGYGYATAAALLRADSIGACHRRERLYWVADSGSTRREGHQQEQCVSVPASASFSVDGDTLARARSALDGDYSGLLHCDGLSVVMERHALKGYGNAIVPQVAAVFIEAHLAATGNYLAGQRDTLTP